MQQQLRVARPVGKLEHSARMYREGLDLAELGRFHDHDGFSGVMLGYAGSPYHLELTSRTGEKAERAPSPEALLVFYIPDCGAWQRRCEAMMNAGFSMADPVNPYWRRSGRTFEDPDGYRVVIQNGDWP